MAASVEQICHENGIDVPDKVKRIIANTESAPKAAQLKSLSIELEKMRRISISTSEKLRKEQSLGTHMKATLLPTTKASSKSS